MDRPGRQLNLPQSYLVIFFVVLFDYIMSFFVANFLHFKSTFSEKTPIILLCI
uniref:Uncharacterized protein n=1 Tax=Anguilla anguilla TaxID=7936 RepID=A0A0E9SY24_ANGAN